MAGPAKRRGQKIGRFALLIEERRQRREEVRE